MSWHIRSGKQLLVTSGCTLAGDSLQTHATFAQSPRTWLIRKTPIVRAASRSFIVEMVVWLMVDWLILQD